MAIFRKRPKPVQLRSLAELEPLLESGQPVLLDFFQFGCAPCKVMDGIVNELAEEYAGSAHVVKVNVAHVPGAVQAFKVRSTPTFVLIRDTGKGPRARLNPRWRASGLVKKDFMRSQLERNGAVTPGSGTPESGTPGSGTPGSGTPEST